MTSLQILMQNLLYDLSQVAIPWDRVDEEFLRRPRKWEPLGKCLSCRVWHLIVLLIWSISLDLLRFVIILGPTSSTIDICTFCLGWFFYGIQTADDQNAV